MRHGIPRRRRYRPFSLAAIFERASARELNLDRDVVARLVDDELIFLADTHASVVYSLFERARRHALCLAIQVKVGQMKGSAEAAVGLPPGLTNAEAGFILALHTQAERQARLLDESNELPPA